MKRSILKLFNAEGIRRAWLAIPLVMILTSGCGGISSNPGGMVEVRIPEASGSPVSGKELPIPGTQAQNPKTMEARLRSQVRQWTGTPHRMGGMSRSGIDCSGFVQMLYRDILIHNIPRTTSLQVKSGRPVTRNRLHTGDLVFFKLPDDKRHVGIYLGRTEFAHVSTSKGVIISDLDDPYWRDYFWTARRYLDQ